MYVLSLVLLILLSACTPTREVWRHHGHSDFTRDEAYCESTSQKNIKTPTRTRCKTESKPSTVMPLGRGFYSFPRNSKTNCVTTGGEVVQVLDRSKYVWCMKMKGYKLIRQYKDKNGVWQDE